METNNSQKTIYQAYEEIKAREISELVTVLKQRGGKHQFDTCEYNPYIMINRDHPEDVLVSRVYLSPDNTPVVIVADDSYDEPYEVRLEDIAYSHIEFITDSIRHAI